MTTAEDVSWIPTSRPGDVQASCVRGDRSDFGSGRFSPTCKSSDSFVSCESDPTIFSSSDRAIACHKAARFVENSGDHFGARRRALDGLRGQRTKETGDADYGPRAVKIALISDALRSLA
jgi:hypothetical protein